MREERRDFVKGLGAMLGLGRSRFRRVDPDPWSSPLPAMAPMADLAAGHGLAGLRPWLPRSLLVTQNLAATLDLTEPVACERNDVVLAWAAGTFLDDGGR